MSARYSNVERKVWRDERVRALSTGAPNARELWLYLLTCDSQGIFPGLFVLRLVVAADDLGWLVDDVRRCLAEVVTKGLAQFDEPTSTVWLPNAARKRVEHSGVTPLNAKGWRNGWDDMPDSEIARRAFVAAVEALKRIAPTEKTQAGAQARAFAATPPPWFSPGGGPGSHSNAEPTPGARSKTPIVAPSNAVGTVSERRPNAVRTKEQEWDLLEQEQEQDAHAREAASGPVQVDELERLLAASADLRDDPQPADLAKLAAWLRSHAFGLGCPDKRTLAAAAFALDQLSLARLSARPTNGSGAKFVATVFKRVARAGGLEAEQAKLVTRGPADRPSQANVGVTDVAHELAEIAKADRASSGRASQPVERVAAREVGRASASLARPSFGSAPRPPEPPPAKPDDVDEPADAPPVTLASLPPRANARGPTPIGALVSLVAAKGRAA